MNSAANIVTKDLDGAVTSYVLPELPGYEARIGANNWKDPASKYTVTLCGQGVFLTRYAGKALSRKNADKAARGWLEEIWADRAQLIAPSK